MKKTFLLIPFFFLGCDQKQDVSSELYQVQVGEVVQKIVFSGKIRSENSILVRAPIDGQLVELKKNLGSKVNKGDVIAIVSEPKNSVRASDLIEKEGQLKQLELRQSQLELKLRRSKEELDSTKRLVASGSISLNEKRSSEIAHLLEIKDLELLKSQKNTLVESIELLKKMQIDSSRALVAPIQGTITELWALEEKITPGMSISKDTVVAVIEENGQYVLKGDVAEPDYIRLSIGQPLEVRLAHHQVGGWKGKIKSMSAAAEKDTFGIGRFNVNAVFSAKDPLLRTGLEGLATVILKSESKQLRVPRSAVWIDGDSSFVSYPGGKAPSKKKIKIAFVGDEYVAIESGLNDGEVIYKSYVE